MEFYKKNGTICIGSDKKEIELGNNAVTVDGMVIDFPGEYEKSGILVFVREFNEKRYFIIQTESKQVAYVPHVENELHNELIEFFGKTSILVTIADKANTKLVEVLESLVIIPYGEGKDVFLSALGQSVEATDRFKMKELEIEGPTIYVNIA